MRGRGNARSVGAKIWIVSRVERVWCDFPRLTLWKLLELALYEVREEDRLQGSARTTEREAEETRLVDIDDERLARTIQKCRGLYQLASAELQPGEGEAIAEPTAMQLLDAVRRAWVQSPNESLGRVLGNIVESEDTTSRTYTNRELYDYLVSRGDRTRDDAMVLGVELERLPALH